MTRERHTALAIPCALLLSAGLAAQQQSPAPRAERGAMLVDVTRSGDEWVTAGKKNRVTLDASSLAVRVQAGPVRLALAPSLKDDMLVRSRGEEFYLRLADAGRIHIEPYDAGFKTGVKIVLDQFRHAGLLRGGEIGRASCRERV